MTIGFGLDGGHDDREFAAGETEKSLPELAADLPNDDPIGFWWSTSGRDLINGLKVSSGEPVDFLLPMGEETGNIRKRDDGSYYVSDHMAEAIYYCARLRKSAENLAREICASNLVADANLPPYLRKFAAEILSGKFDRVSKRGRKMEEQWYRNLLIVRAIAAAEKLGIPPTGKERSIEAQRCGCALAAEAMRRAGIGTTDPDGVAKVWGKRAEFSEFDDTVREIPRHEAADDEVDR